MKRIGVSLLIVVPVLAGCGSVQKEIAIPKSTIQEMVDAKFPYDKNVVVARFTLRSPEIYLAEPNIGMKLAYSANFLSKKISGTVDFNGQIVYKAEEGAFYLSDFDIVEIAVEQANFSDQAQLKDAIHEVVNNYLDGFPVYRLNPDDFKQNLSKLLLKDVRVHGDDVIVVLGV
ncbi:MAG: DUF1439 domain-containing protein [Candidatus Hydrogenedentes bacterium]|nr:DUF1439 domain-containing protein [Candidatus Hydrogenedentota bacterium]